MTAPAPTYDRSIVDGPLAAAVWRLAWPTMLVNIISGLQSLVDQVLVGHIIGFTGNAAIGVANQIYIAVFIFVGSIFTRRCLSCASCSSAASAC
jgi:Na+-driven multidrug efflux pump